MTARTTMATLISRLRLLINDPAGASQTFTDDQLQAQLDLYAEYVRYRPMAAIETISNTGTVTYLEYQSQKYYEDSPILTDGSYNTVTATTTNAIDGRYTFAASRTPPLLITGTRFDIYAAAGDCWDLKAASVATSVDFSADGLSVKRGSIIENYQKMSMKYHNMSEAGSSMSLIYRTDLNVTG